MRKLAYLMLVPSLLYASGCNPSSTSTTESDSPASTTESGDDHGGEGQHGHKEEGHAHGIGPHGGTIADWGGGEYHVEFTVDHDQQQATVHVLGGDAETPVPIDADSIELSIGDPEMLVTLDAAPQGRDPEGQSSRFTGTHEKLSVVQEYAGTVTGVIDGTPYSGDFQEHPHGDHEH